MASLHKLKKSKLALRDASGKSKVSLSEQSLRPNLAWRERVQDYSRRDQPRTSTASSPESQAEEWSELQAAPNDSELDRRDESEDLRDQMRKMEIEHEKALKIKDERHARNMRRLSDELYAVEKRAQDMTAEMRNKLHGLQAVKSEADKDRQRMEQDHASEVSALTRKVHMAKEEVAERRQMEEALKARLNDMSCQLQYLHKDLDKAKAQASHKEQHVAQGHAKSIHELKETHADIVSKSEQEYQQSMRQLQHKAEDTRLQMAHDYEAKLDMLIQDIRRVKNESEMKEQQMAAEHRMFTDELKDAREMIVSRLKQEHEQKIRHLQIEIEEINEAWLNRDDELYKAMLFTPSGLPRKPDNAIKDQMFELQRMIDDLSRTEWKPSQEIWPNDVLEKSSNEQYSQREFKRALVQDLIWSLLYRRIFCSPFRMLGEEGKNIEREWNEQCGKGQPSGDQLYTWPEPGVKTERWRYMTLKECRNILTMPILSPMDNRAEVKRSFQISQNKLAAALEDELGQIVQLAEQETQLIKRLSKKAAVVWLDFAMHRCRIVVHATGTVTKTTIEKVSIIQKGSLALTILPTVGRYGNVKGVELDCFTIIGGCEGNKLDIS